MIVMIFPLGSLPPSIGEDRPAVTVTAMLVTVGRHLPVEAV